MGFVLTLIAAPGSGALDGALTQAVAAAVGATPGQVDWLAPGEACDIPVGPEIPDRLTAQLREILGARPVDIGVQSAEDRRKGLLVADMDATMVVGETLDELAAEVGLKREIAEITRRAMAGELDFAAALRARVGQLAGLPAETLERTIARTEPSPGAATLVRTMRAHGATCVLVSGGFSQFTEAVGARLGFHETHGNRLALRDGALTGQVVDPILGQDAKLAILRRTAADLGLTLQQTCSVGDGANDAPMLAAAGLGVAYRPKAPARAAARVAIDHGDLTALLYLQGYRRGEFSA